MRLTKVYRQDNIVQLEFSGYGECVEMTISAGSRNEAKGIEEMFDSFPFDDVYIVQR